MSGVEKPIYLVTRGDQWAKDRDSPNGAVPAFGTVDEAQAYAGDVALQRFLPLSQFKIVEFVASGNVIEA